MAAHDTPAAATAAFAAAALSARARRPADRPMPASSATDRIAARTRSRDAQPAGALQDSPFPTARPEERSR